jgi:hypothetical protein
VSAPDPRRYGRQLRLVEIGAAGQARICAASVVVRSVGLARDVEERYVRTSGLQVVDAGPSIEPARVEHEADVARLGLRHAEPRAVAEGALRALVALRAALARGDGSP